jgi:F0F1-type ATP synthase assembly protein I
MNKTLTPHQTPSPTDGDPTTRTGGELQVFVMSALNMSWQLAIVVLAPIIIGNKVDISLKAKPWFTVVGLLLAVAGTVLVIRSAIKRADEAMAAEAERSKHD